MNFSYCIFLVAGIWAIISAFVWKSISPNQIVIRRIVFAGSLASVALILFAGFLISRVFVMNEILNTPLPGTALHEDSKPSDQVELTVNILKDGQFKIGNELLTSNTLTESLKKHLSIHPKLAVTLSSDPKASYSDTVTALDACSVLNIEHVTFMVDGD